MNLLIKNQHKQIIDWTIGKNDYHKHYFELENKYFFINPEGYFAYAIPKDICLIDIEKFKHNLSLEQGMVAEYTELIDLQITNKFIKSENKEFKEFYRSLEGKDNLVYVNNKLLAKFKNCTYKQVKRSEFGTIYIYKEGILVGLVLPTKLKENL